MTAYQLTRHARSKSIKIRVVAHGEVKVTAPRYTPKIMIDAFVKRSQPWIEAQQRKATIRQQAFPTLDTQGKLVSYLGKLYTYTYQPEPQATKITTKGDTLFVAPITGLEKDVAKTLTNWLQTESKQYFYTHVPYWAKHMGVSYQRLRFGQQTSRWGSCSSNGTLSFNWRLIHFKEAVINYVIIHELAHVQEMNHAPEFWKIVKQFSPDYKQHVRFLKQQQLAVL